MPRPCKLPPAEGARHLPRRVTLRDVAAAEGVSANTVTLALRDSPRISAVTRARVQKAALAMGYEPDPMLSALAYYRHSSAGRPLQAELAWLNFWDEPETMREHPLCAAVWKGAVEAGGSLGYRVEEFVFGGINPMSPQRLQAILRTRGIRGILLPPQRPAVPPEKFKFDWSQFAAVRIGRNSTFPPVNVVTHGQAHDMVSAVQKIRSKGYHRIGVVTESALAPPISLFDAGFLMAQQTLPDIKRIPILELDSKESLTPLKVTQFDDWMKKRGPDAVISAYPHIGALARAAGYRVPQDVALAAATVSMSDVDAGNYENPEEVGRSAVRSLVGHLLRNELGIPDYTYDILVRATWVDGPTMPARRPPHKAQWGGVPANEKAALEGRPASSGVPWVPAL